MRLLAVVVVCGLIAAQDGGSAGAALPRSDFEQRPHSTAVFSAGFTRRATGEDLISEDAKPCFSLRENEEQQQQLLCNNRRSKFNINPFGLRFGKRQNSYMYRRAIKRARRNKFSPISLFPREVEIPT